MLIRQSSATFTTHGEQLMNFLNKDTASADAHTSSSGSVKGPVNMPQMPSSSLSSSLPSGTHQMPAVTYPTLSVALPPPIPKVCFFRCQIYALFLLIKAHHSKLCFTCSKVYSVFRWVSNYRQSNNLPPDYLIRLFEPSNGFFVKSFSVQTFLIYTI